MNEWISINDELPKGKCLVFIEREAIHNNIHSALFEDDFQIVGSHFEWDMPKVTHWMPLPEPPEDI